MALGVAFPKEGKKQMSHSVPACPFLNFLFIFFATSFLSNVHGAYMK